MEQQGSVCDKTDRQTLTWVLDSYTRFQQVAVSTAVFSDSKVQTCGPPVLITDKTKEKLLETENLRN